MFIYMKDLIKTTLKLFSSLIIICSSCSLNNNCSNESIYKFMFNIHVGDSNPQYFEFPSLPELNVIKDGKYYFINDTMMTFGLGDTIFTNFIYKLKCNNEKIKLIDYEVHLYSN